jgi:hypothetical protein
MISWQTVLAAYLAGSVLTAGVLGRYLAAVRRRYPIADRPRTPRERRRRR